MGTVGLVVTAVVSVVLLVAPAGAFGLWEPWETTWAQAARQMAESGDWLSSPAGKSGYRPLLPLWLIALGHSLFGGSELGLRLPQGLVIAGGATLVYWWLKESTTPLRAMLASIAVVVSPMVILGGVSLAGHGAYVGLFMATIAAWGLAQNAEQRSGERTTWVWSLAVGLLLALDALAMGVWGVALPLLTIGVAATTEALQGRAQRRMNLVVFGPACGVLAGLGAWLYWQEGNATALRVFSLSVVATIAAALVVRSYRTSLMSPASRWKAAVVGVPPLLALVLLAVTAPELSNPAADAVPAGLARVTDNFLGSATALPSHVEFDFWVRQIGFGALPWTVIAPLGLAFAFRRDGVLRGDVCATDPDVATDDGYTATWRLLVAWMIVSVCVMLFVGTVHRHYVFTATAPIAIAAVLVLSDRELWLWLRTRPNLSRTFGFVAICGALFLLKDLDRYPAELLGPLLVDGKAEIPEDFRYGATLKVARGVLVGALAVYFFAVPSVLTRWIRRLFKKQKLPEQLAGVANTLTGTTLEPAVNAALAAERRKDQPTQSAENPAEEPADTADEATPDDAVEPGDDGEPTPEAAEVVEEGVETQPDTAEKASEPESNADAGDEQDETPHEATDAQAFGHPLHEDRVTDDGVPIEALVDEGVRRSAGVVGRIARWTEGPTRFTLLFVTLAIVWGGLVGLKWIPDVSHHLSLKGLLNSYEDAREGDEPLLTYQVTRANESYYLADLDKIASLAAFKEQFRNDDSRVFVIFPRARLANLNYELRRSTTPRRNIHVVDNRSGQFVLASNLLREGEEEQSVIAHAILPERPKPVFESIALDEKNQRAYPQFDARIQLIGYEVYDSAEVNDWGEPTDEARNRLQAIKNRGELPSFRTGSTMVIRYYFKVLKRITSGYEIFLHVDYPGTRINGDHVPVGEAFPVNYWLPGDYIVDTQWLGVDRGSSSGEYEMFMGFFRGNRRMKVTPRSAHDGGDRVRLGKINVTTF